jgi:hypothetical protein
MESSEAQSFNCLGSLSTGLMPSGDRVQFHQPSLFYREFINAVNLLILFI